VRSRHALGSSLLLDKDQDLAKQAEEFAKQFPDSTVSLGGELHGKLMFGAMGVTPVFYMEQRDFSIGGVGTSRTFGVGEYEGLYVSWSTLNDKTTWSVGVFMASPIAAGMAALDVTDLVFEGQLHIDIGAVVGPGLLEVSEKLDVSGMVIDLLDKISNDVLAPLGDPRSFQDPFQDLLTIP
jgi:hypothetical protein